MRSYLPILVAALLSAPGCKKLETKAEKQTKTEHAAADEKRIRQACASQASYDRLKALAFEKARDVRSGESAMLDRLAAATVGRMEDPVVKSRDESLNVTICKGRMVIELPPGAEDAFNGERRLVAEVEYAVQAAVDGSGLVYQLDGAEPIIYRLAAIGLKGDRGPLGSVPALTPVAEMDVAAAAEPAPAPRPVATARPVPAPPRASHQPEPPRRLARPSFDCRYARTRTERMVCADERLAARDRVMASLYYRVIASTDPETSAILRDTRDYFLAERERCRTPACVADVYEDRMDEIERIASGE
jgi:hypothetical protein